MTYALLLAGIICLCLSVLFIGPIAWILGILGIVLLISSYLWEVYWES